MLLPQGGDELLTGAGHMGATEEGVCGCQGWQQTNSPSAKGPGPRRREHTPSPGREEDGAVALRASSHTNTAAQPHPEENIKHAPAGG